MDGNVVLATEQMVVSSVGFVWWRLKVRREYLP
jgi:hypothetical protein